MLLARFEQPDGGFSVMSGNQQLGATLSQSGTLLLGALPAGIAGTQAQAWPRVQLALSAALRISQHS